MFFSAFIVKVGVRDNFIFLKPEEWLLSWDHGLYSWVTHCDECGSLLSSPASDKVFRQSPLESGGSHFRWYINWIWRYIFWICFGRIIQGRPCTVENIELNELYDDLMINLDILNCCFNLMLLQKPPDLSCLRS